METGELAADSRRFFWLTQAFVVLLFGLQLSLCLQAEWGGGFAISDITSVQFFNFHPLLNILAFGVASTESLISFKALGLRHAAAKTVHACLQLASFLFGIAALTVVILFHNSNEFPNFYSVHSWIGMAVYVLSWCQFLSGLLIFWLPGFAPGTVKAAYLRYHKIGGLGIAEEQRRLLGGSGGCLLGADAEAVLPAQQGPQSSAFWERKPPGQCLRNLRSVDSLRSPVRVGH